ncbi:hypothetical protein BC937DRAFT_93117 [Endogone sp. FLAS-F59071]|nr:hypothetical protein BC937DRAFT_93117 [Endogone sp. FLAS-F59071]|eukprot:RUS14951.1 hypothetical protein BC937DRAFT_93117 [Endogone sp. FLAS-F59071]
MSTNAQPIFFPFTFIIPEQPIIFVHPQGTNPSPQSNTINPAAPTPAAPTTAAAPAPQQQSNSNATSDAEPQQVPHFHFYFTLPPVAAAPQQPGAGIPVWIPYMFNMGPNAFQQPSFQGQPPASQKAIQNLPIVKITPQHVADQASCAICQDIFTTDPSSSPVRQMPCGHLFCEPCLFQWLAQSNTCPTCRFEILTDNDEYNTGVHRRMREREETSDKKKAAEPNHHHEAACTLAAVGVCGVESEGSRAVTLPQCGHRFHVSCLRTSLLIEGHNLEEEEREGTINLLCPSCRANSTIESTMLVLEEQAEQVVASEDSLFHEKQAEQTEQQVVAPEKDSLMREEPAEDKVQRYRTTVEDVDEMDVDL